MIPLILLGLALQTPEELLRRLEEKAAAARPVVLRTRMIGDALSSGELIERTCASGRIEVSRAGTFWDEDWGVWIGPERKGVTTTSVRTLTTRDNFFQLARKLQGFGPKMEEKRLETFPRGGAWKDHRSLDPWLSREGATVADGVDPLLLYSLMPELLRTENELRIQKAEDKGWTLEVKRPGGWGSITKRFEIRKEDLSFSSVTIEEVRGTFTYRYEFEADAFGFIGRQVFPLGTRARFHGFPKVVRWNHRVEDGAPEPRARTAKDFPERRFAAPGPLDRKAVELRRVLRPDDPAPLVDLAWGEFPWKRWWHYRYFDERENNRWMLKALRELDPASAIAREEWLKRTWNPGDRDEAWMLDGAPAPLYNHAAYLFAGGKPAEAEAVARSGLAAAEASGDRLNWTCLLVAILQRKGRAQESAALWMDLAEALGGNEPSTQVFLAEIALGRGLAAGFDPGALRKRGGIAGAYALILLGEGEAYPASVRTISTMPWYRPLMSELVFRRPLADAALAKDLAAVADVDTILAAAALRRAAGEKVEDLCANALALWEKDSAFGLWRWDGWGRTTLRMLRHLRALGQEASATHLAGRFVEKCAEEKVPMWLGQYRWGELVGECLLPLRTQGKDERFVELLALSPDLAGRIAFSQRKGFDFPMKEILDHLGKTRNREEAAGWVRMASTRDLKGEALRPLAALAFEIDPGNLYVENAWLEATGTELPIEKKADLLRRTIAAMKAGTYRDRTGGNYGMTFERLARLQLEAGRLDDAAATTREMIREYPDMDSMSVINLGYAFGGRGRKDLARELYLVAARHNAHMRPFSAQTVIERLEPLGEDREIYALSIRTRETWKDGGGRDRDSERSHLEAIRKAGERAAAKVKWEEVFKPTLEQPRAPLPKEHAALAERSVEDLRADEPERRDRAERILTLLGEGVFPFLRNAALEGGPEERARARAVVERIWVEEWK